MKRQRNPRVHLASMVPVTSMMDMFTIILVFLLNFLDPTTAQTGDLHLPVSASTRQVEDAPSVTVARDEVRVGPDAVFSLVDRGGVPTIPDTVGRSGRRIDVLYERLRAAGASAGGATGDGVTGATLLVQCDRQTPFAVLSDVLATAGDAGFAQFRFVVISEPE